MKESSDKLISNENEEENNNATDQQEIDEDERKLLEEEKEETAKLKKKLIEIEKVLERKETNPKSEEKEDENENKNIDDLRKKTDILDHFYENRNTCSYDFCLYTLFSFVLPFSVIINLIGIFQIISVMNALWIVIYRTIFRVLDFDDKDDPSYYDFYNFYGFYFDSSFDEGINYDLIETMNFLGILLVKFYGFSISSLICMVLNILALILIMVFFSEYNETKENYNFTQFLYLLGCYILLFFGVGSSALLSQQILIDNYKKYQLFLQISPLIKRQREKILKRLRLKESTIEERNRIEREEEEKEKEKENENQEMNEPDFILICISSILGFLFKYLFDIIFSYYRNSFEDNYDEEHKLDINDTTSDSSIFELEKNIQIFNHDKSLFYFIFLIYGGSIVLSIILYKLLFKECSYENDYVRNDEKKKNEKNKECYFFGYIIFFQKYDNKNNNIPNDNSDNNNNIKNELEISINEEEEVVGGIGQVTQIVSKKGPEPKIEKNEILQEQEPLQPQTDRIEEEKIIIPKKTVKVVKRTIFNRAFQRFKKYCTKVFLCLRLLSDSFINCCNKIVCDFFCGKECCYFCCCCECCPFIGNVTENQYELNEGYFCYCYKAKRHMKWFKRFISDKTQKKVIPLLLQYFFIQIITVAFDLLYDENIEDGFNQFKDSLGIFFFVFIFLSSLFLFFYLTISFGLLTSYITGHKKRKKKKVVLGEMTSELSNNILNGTYGIIIFNSFYSFILSCACISREIKNNYFFYIPIFLNKFYYFTFAHQCAIRTDDEESLNYFTTATLLSIYLFIWDLIIEQIKLIPVKILLFIQIILSLIIIIFSLLAFTISLFCIGNFLFTLLYCLTSVFIVPFGGFWFIDHCYEKNKNKFEEYEEKKFSMFKNKDCLKKLFCGEERLNKMKNKLLLFK